MQHHECGIDLGRLQLGHQLATDVDRDRLVTESGEAVLDLGA